MRFESCVSVQFCLIHILDQHSIEQKCNTVVGNSIQSGNNLMIVITKSCQKLTVSASIPLVFLCGMVGFAKNTNMYCLFMDFFFDTKKQKEISCTLERKKLACNWNYRIHCVIFVCINNMV